MSDNHPELGLDALSSEQRYELAMTLLDTVFAERFAPSVPAEHLAEVRRRLAAPDAASAPGEPWRIVLDRTRAGL